MINKVNWILSFVSAADMVKVDDSPLLRYIEVGENTGAADDEVIVANWHDEEGMRFVERITVRQLANASIEGNTIHYNDAAGNRSCVSLFRLVPMEIDFKESSLENPCKAQA